MHVPSIPGWLNAMDEGAGWSPFQWLRSVSDVPDGHLFTSTSSLHILRPVPRLLHFGPTGVDVFERLRDGYICSTTWPSLLVALCHQIFSPAGVLGKFLTGTQYDKWWFKCLSTKISLELPWRLPYIAIHRSIHSTVVSRPSSQPLSLGICVTIELMANLSSAIHALLPKIGQIRSQLQGRFRFGSMAMGIPYAQEGKHNFLRHHVPTANVHMSHVLFYLVEMCRLYVDIVLLLPGSQVRSTYELFWTVWECPGNSCHLGYLKYGTFAGNFVEIPPSCQQPVFIQVWKLTPASRPEWHGIWAQKRAKRTKTEFLKDNGNAKMMRNSEID